MAAVAKSCADQLLPPGSPSAACPAETGLLGSQESPTSIGGQKRRPESTLAIKHSQKVYLEVYLEAIVKGHRLEDIVRGHSKKA
ncbi:hypothetical protein FKM82_000550 [Ascaphus truei]